VKETNGSMLVNTGKHVKLANGHKIYSLFGREWFFRIKEKKQNKIK
jgi:hypothetical protein